MHCFTNYHLFYTKFDGDFKNDIKNCVLQSHDAKMTSNVIDVFPNFLTFLENFHFLAYKLPQFYFSVIFMVVYMDFDGL